MPTYEYACRDCGHHVEVVQSFRDDPLTECASCGGRLRKVYGATGIIFKGSGYYVTDSRAKAAEAKKAKKAEKAGTDAGEGTGGAKEPAATDTSTAGTTEQTAKSA